MYLNMENGIKQTIQEIGGTMPENLPVAENIKRLEQKQKKSAKSKIKNTIDNATKYNTKFLSIKYTNRFFIYI